MMQEPFPSRFKRPDREAAEGGLDLGLGARDGEQQPVAVRLVDRKALALQEPHDLLLLRPPEEGARLIGRVISIYSSPRCPRSAHFHAASTPVINVN